MGIGWAGIAGELGRLGLQKRRLRGIPGTAISPCREVQRGRSRAAPSGAQQQDQRHWAHTAAQQVSLYGNWLGWDCGRAGAARPAEEEAQGDPRHGHQPLQGGAERTEPGCTQRCPAAGPEALGTHCSTAGFPV